MSISRTSWVRALAPLAVAILVAGCGGSQPDAEEDPTGLDDATEDVASAPEVEEPEPRDETPQWVDPNVEYKDKFGNIHFEFDKYRILAKDKPTLELNQGRLAASCDEEQRPAFPFCTGASVPMSKSEKMLRKDDSASSCSCSAIHPTHVCARLGGID